MSTPLPPVPTAAPTAGSSGSTVGPAGEAPVNTSVRRADGTSTRRPRRSPIPRHDTASPTLKADVAVLKASGMTANSIAKTLGKNPRTIDRLQQLPEVRARITELRETWKAVAQTKVEGMAEDAWNMASSFVEQRDSKAFDNTLRGLVAMEKISASVSGEGQKVEVSGSIQGPPQVELKALVMQLFRTSPNG